jgi:hypothetical protein
LGILIVWQDIMTRINQSKQDLEEQLKQQIGFLISSCHSYDQGKHPEAKRIATILRTLFHRTKTCKPLLGQLQLNTIRYFNSATPYDPQNLVSHMGLVSIKFISGMLPSLIPKAAQPQESKQQEYQYLDFSQWWTRPVMVAIAGAERRYYSRQNLVLNVAETDGGAHVDEGLDKIYNELSRQNGLGINAIVKDKKYPLLYPELPCLRQIGHEVLLTLKKFSPQLFDEPYYDEIAFTPTGSKIDDLSSQIGIEIYVRKGAA